MFLFGHGNQSDLWEFEHVVGYSEPQAMLRNDSREMNVIVGLSSIILTSLEKVRLVHCNPFQFRNAMCYF